MVVAATRKPKPLFSLGDIFLTPGAIAVLNESRQDVASLLRRHVTGDWGTLCDDDKQMNDDALECGARIFSAYVVGNDEKLWIITEADRASTTVLRPDEY
ncbi:hypothetical protein LCGC14_2424680 [marine sediment metagenome]|uniref:Plasmid related protein n=1 Tax=marine sediment metagenome TaxID=412755 RepID=A0A0F9CAU6_9ZZZZ